MKNILFVVLCFLSFCSSVFGQSIMLSSSTSSVDINTTFGLTIQVQGIQNPGEVQIQGVDQFVVRGQAQSTSMQVINGEQSLQIQLQLQLQPLNAGNFTLGPARISLGTETLESNILTIDVTGEKLFLQPQAVNTLLGASEDDTVEESLPALGEENISPPSTSSRRWLLLVGVLALVYYFLWKGKQGSKINPSQIQLPPKIYPLPREDDVDFRKHMDLRWRGKLSILTNTDCSAGTYQELQLLIEGLSEVKQEIIVSAFKLLQQARYTESEIDRTSISELAKRFISLSGK